jgi:hypothetical protein
MRFFVLENFSNSKNNIIYAQAAKVLWLFMYSRMRVNQSNLAREPGGSSQGGALLAALWGRQCLLRVVVWCLTFNVTQSRDNVQVD